ncbi:MAG: mechanosensitive ion channel family protein [Myxococcota bacterium]
MDWLEEMPWREAELLGNSVRQWLLALAVAVGTALVTRVLKAIVATRLEKSARAKKTRVLRIAGRAIGHTRWFFYLMLGVFLGAKFLELPEAAHGWINALAAVAVLVQIGVWAQHAIRHAVEHVQSQREAEGAPPAGMVVALGFVGQLIVWAIVLLLVLSNLGVEITTLVAGLGIGGLAVALAMQSVFSDLIAAITIYFDRPFDVGDFIVVDGRPGTVKKVGIRSTRVAALSGEELVFPNGDLLKSTIQNYARMRERRIVFEIGVVYQTPIEKVRRIPDMIREIIESQETARFDRAHFKAFGDFALVFEAVYYVLAPQYDVYMSVQQAINLELARQFEEEGIEFAYPTTTVHLEQSLVDAGKGPQREQERASGDAGQAAAST